MSGTIVSQNLETGGSFSLGLQWERNYHTFLAQVTGPFAISLADVVGDFSKAHWRTLFSEKSTHSNQLLRKIMGRAYPVDDFFQILCAKPSKILTNKQHAQWIEYWNADITIRVDDLRYKQNTCMAHHIQLLNKNKHQTDITIDTYELGHTPLIVQEHYQERLRRLHD